MNPCPWDGWQPAAIDFCERRLCAWIVEPANTYSNLGPVAVGLLILWLAHKRDQAPAFLLGSAVFVLGWASFLFHASATHVGEVLDLGGMFVIGGLFVIYATDRLRQWSTIQMTLILLSQVILLTGLVIWFPVWGIAGFALQLTVAGVCEIVAFRQRPRPSYRDLWFMVAVFAAGLGFWILDFSGVMCNPDNHYMNGHAAWHLLSGVALYYFYRFQFVPPPTASA